MIMKIPPTHLTPPFYFIFRVSPLGLCHQGARLAKKWLPLESKIDGSEDFHRKCFEFPKIGSVSFSIGHSRQ